MTSPDDSPGVEAKVSDQAPAAELAEPTRLRLYISRSTPNSVRAEQNLGTILGSLACDPTPVPEIIDVFLHGKRAAVDGVIVTPTLVVLRGNKRHVMVGDLSDASHLRALLR